MKKEINFNTDGMKQHVGLVVDNSGSMFHLTNGAIADFNATIKALKDSASEHKLDTIVTVTSVTEEVSHDVVISNPHVLHEKTEWKAEGGTALYDGIGAITNLLSSLPDEDNPKVTYLILITTDGEEVDSSIYNARTISALMHKKTDTGRWKYVFRVPKGYRHLIEKLGVAKEDIHEWDTTDKGIEESTKVTTAAVKQHYSNVASGKKSGAFFANAADVTADDLSKLDDVTAKISLYVVPSEAQGGMGMEMLPFILTKRQKMLKGSAFYQLTKTEARISPDARVILRKKPGIGGKDDGKLYSGPLARKLIGLPEHQNARLHPGDFGQYDIFIQSHSTNRKLVADTGVCYWPEIGVEFTEEEYNRYKPKDVPVAKVDKTAIVLPTVAPSSRPTKSPIPVTSRKKVDTNTYYASRRLARFAADILEANGNRRHVKDAGVDSPKGKRWYTEA